jgi:hypothetical protein
MRLRKVISARGESIANTATTKYLSLPPGAGEPDSSAQAVFMAINRSSPAILADEGNGRIRPRLFRLP